MATDILKPYSNERVDLLDFQYLADEQFQAGQRQLAAQFMVDPNKRRLWILGGFETTNPAAQQVQVTRGRAFLAQREGGLIYYTTLAAEGDATKIIDASVLANGTYNVYVRFEYVDGDSGSRIFWNPAGTGSEFAQTVETHRLANWSMRAELASPGAEWEKVAEFTVAGGVITVGPLDRRTFYFEGAVGDAFESGWSSDGGGSANDRSADRGQYGVFDLQTFTGAMRQGLEDIKGRGLRRWWDRDIGGMNIGFDDDPVEDRLAVGAASTYFSGAAGSPRLQLDADTYFEGSAGNEQLFLTTNTHFDASSGAEHLQVQVDFGLYYDPTDPELRFDSSDRLAYDRTANEFMLEIAGIEEVVVGASGMAIANGLYVGSASGVPVDNEIYAEGQMSGTNVYARSGGFYRDANDYILIGNGTQHQFVINGVEEFRIKTTGITVENGLYVGSTAGTPTDKDIYAEGDIEAGNSMVVGYRLTVDDSIGCGAAYHFGLPTSDDWISFISNTMSFVINGSTELSVSATTVSTNNNNLNAGSGTVSCGSVSSSGAISGTTLTGTSLGVGTGAITGGLITAQTRFVSSGTTNPSELGWATFAHNPTNIDPGSDANAHSVNYLTAPWVMCNCTSTGVFNTQTSWNISSTTNDADGEYSINTYQGDPHPSAVMFSCPDNSSGSAYYHSSAYSSYNGFGYDIKVYTWNVSVAGLRDHGFSFIAFGP